MGLYKSQGSRPENVDNDSLDPKSYFALMDNTVAENSGLKEKWILNPRVTRDMTTDLSYFTSILVGQMAWWKLETELLLASRRLGH